MIGDVVDAGPEHRVASLTEGIDFPSTAAEQAEWCGGEVVWEADDLAVIRAVYDSTAREPHPDHRGGGFGATRRQSA